MNRDGEICGRRLGLHAGVGASTGALLVALLLAFDIAGLGTMLQQVSEPAAHVVLIFAKPMMVLGLSGLAWSVWRQLDAREARLANGGRTRHPAHLSGQLLGARS